MPRTAKKKSTSKRQSPNEEMEKDYKQVKSAVKKVAKEALSGIKTLTGSGKKKSSGKKTRKSSRKSSKSS